MSLKKAWNVATSTFNQFSEDRAMTLGAALAYYAVFSLGPLLLIAVGVAGVLFGEQSSRQQLTHRLQSVVGPQTAHAIDSMMASQSQGGSWISMLVGIGVLFLTASGVFVQLKTSLNRIWNVREKSDRGVIGVILNRLLALLMVFGIGIVLLISIFLTTSISGFYQSFGSFIPGFVAQIFNLVLFVGIITVLFALIFKFLPDVEIRWREVWAGAFTTAILFVAGEYLLSLYLGRKGAGSAFGAAGSVVLILMWFYYSSLILFVGAEFTQVYAREKGFRIRPSNDAESSGQLGQPGGSENPGTA